MPSYQRIPPRRPIPWSFTVRLWALLAAGLAAVLAAVAWSERVPAPLGATASDTTFSAERAWPALAYLADTAGYRVPGTPAHDRAREYLLRRLAAIPGVEVEEQDALGMREGSRTVLAYRVRNVLARIPGRRPAAVLVSSHYDSPAESVGAADAGIAVAAMLEAVRAIAAGGPLEHSVIFHFNDGEEQGLLGAHAFVRHPWFADVRAFINLESAGNAGKAILFQAGPGNSWLTRRYARSAPHAYGSVIGQDIFQSGLIPSGTDFEIYTGAGLRGLDVAFYRGGWAYHTVLDQAAAVDAGSIQHMGDNMVAAVRALATGELPGDTGGSPSVYYDVLGIGMLAYDHTVATVLAAAAALLLTFAIVRLVSRGLLSARETIAGALFALGGVVLAIALAVGVAAAGPYVLGRAHGWFAHPMRAVVAYGGAAVTGLLLTQAAFATTRRVRDRTVHQRAAAAWAGALVVHAAALVALTALGIGSGYLFLWWVVGGAVGLLLLAREGEPRWALAIAVGSIPAALLTAQTGYLLVELFAPIAGRFPADIPFDPVLAAVIAVPAVVLLVAPLAVVQRAERIGALAAVVAVASLAGLATVWLSMPYTAERPQRIVIEHEDDGGRASLRMWAMDHPGAARAAAVVGGMGEPGEYDSAHTLPAPPLDALPAEVTLIAERRVAGGGREMDLVVRPHGAYEVALATADDRPVRWQPTGVERRAAGATPRIVLLAAPEAGWRVTARTADARPLALVVTTRRHRPSPAADSLMRRLPGWAAAYAETVVKRELRF